jgi:membrane-associated protease RseP (regulator of RpoE activity)
MQSALLWILGIVIFLVIVSISVGLHEASHMLFGKLFKLQVPKFFIGFGKTIWSFKTKNTEYGVKWIPLGGFVEIEDPKVTDVDDPDRKLLSHVHPFKRIVIFLAGAVTNLLIGSIILVSLFMTIPEYVSNTKIVDSVNCGTDVCAAAEAGVKDGDQITAIDGIATSTYTDIAPAIANKSSVVLSVLRDGESLQIPVELNDGKLGITLGYDEVSRTFTKSVTDLGNLFVMNVKAIGQVPQQVPNVFMSIFGAERNQDGISSVVTVGKAYGDVAATPKYTFDSKVETMVMYAGLLNIGLGLANVLPILPLDGGRALVSLLDWFKMGFRKVFTKKQYKPITAKTVSIWTVITGSVLFGFMALLIVADIVSPLTVIG